MVQSRTLEYELLSAVAKKAVSKGNNTGTRNEIPHVQNARGSRYRLSNVKSTTTVPAVRHVDTLCRAPNIRKNLHL